MAVRFTGFFGPPRMQRPNLTYLAGSVIVAIMALAVFVGGANAGDCSRSKSAEASSTQADHKAGQTAEAET